MTGHSRSKGGGFDEVHDHAVRVREHYEALMVDQAKRSHMVAQENLQLRSMLGTMENQNQALRQTVHALEGYRDKAEAQQAQIDQLQNEMRTLKQSNYSLQVYLQQADHSRSMAAPVALPAAALDPSFLSIVTNEAWSTVGLGSSVIMAVVVVFFSQGMSPPLDFPVAQLRAASISDKYISVKVGSELGFYLIDLDGQFYNRAKLDQLLQVPLALGAANAATTAATTRASSTRPKPKEPFRAPIRTDLPKTEWKKK
ncbi:hypothetical protein DYB37_004620 [Aphanomyces astaci]|uniref:Uncharacterized protein n=2 Tax=Aphanomyces astaci TaxID=112090 RepID=A0A397FGL1_APHAT|nr:hypothetical protein DYB30_003076 [Aphanomyces astaci]RHY44323.1 hypothetical protein DYB34_000934 [Aphanomyces astaci]RHY87459.1 hypothetical protein DYB35_006591 [Aphanomyces astaci]RHZ24172.1 hypothetical protein DYB31_008970 [Aphanomyces astaci]RHZ28003.1 hypothetical protein DYB37_004620 [Aphanomyces astaci]